jgi:tRNA threonylcarbamoyladenosine biosynthesis protein TsaE
MKKVIYSNSKEQTQKLGEMIAPLLTVGTVITLDGDLGAGKTTFTQGLGRGLLIKDNINSPTFNILKCYFNGRLPLYHIDAYRLEDGVNNQIGLEEVIEGDGIAVVEWSKFIIDMIYNPLRIIIERMSDNQRRITFESENEMYAELFDRLEEINYV